MFPVLIILAIIGIPTFVAVQVKNGLEARGKNPTGWMIVTFLVGLIIMAFAAAFFYLTMFDFER